MYPAVPSPKQNEKIRRIRAVQKIECTYTLYYEVLNVISSRTYMSKLIMCVWVLTLTYTYS